MLCDDPCMFETRYGNKVKLDKSSSAMITADDLYRPYTARDIWWDKLEIFIYVKLHVCQYVTG